MTDDTTCPKDCAGQDDDTVCESCKRPAYNDTTTTDREEAARAATPGPWGWFGYAGGSGNIYLATIGNGRRYVMDFVRWGMTGAAPRFQVNEGHGGEMVRADRLAQFVVGDQSIVGVQNRDGSVYRSDIRGISHPDARHIALNDPATILADIEEGKRKDATIERLREAAKAVVARYHMEIMSDGDTHEFLAALKEATDEA